MDRRERARLAVIGVCLPLLAFGVVSAAVIADGRLGWDLSIMRFVDRDEFEPPGNDGRTTTYIAGLGAIAVVVAVGGLLRRRRLREALTWVIAVVGTVPIEIVLKDAFERPPEDPSSTGYTFPSGHAMASMVCLLMLLLTWPRQGRAVVASIGGLFILAFGTLIVEGQGHYPSDVVAGWCVAIAWSSAVWLIVGPSASDGYSDGRRRSALHDADRVRVADRGDEPAQDADREEQALRARDDHAEPQEQQAYGEERGATGRGRWAPVTPPRSAGPPPETTLS